MKRFFAYLKNLSRPKKWLLGVVACLALVIFSISAVVATQAGSRWVLLKVAQLANMQLGELKGNLLTGMDIASLDLQQGDVKIHAEKIIFRWQPVALFYNTVSVQSFAAENIQVHLPPAKQEPEPEIFSWPSLALPIRIQLANVSLRDIHLQQGEQQWQLDRISGFARLGTFNLRLRDLVISNPQFTLTSNGSMRLRYPYASNLKSHWRYAASDDLLLEGDADISGDINTINLVHKLQQPLKLASSGKISPALHNKTQKPYMELGSEWSEQTIPAIFLQNQVALQKFPFLQSLVTMQGYLKLQGWLDSYQLLGAVRSKTQDRALTADLDIQGVYAADAKNKSAPPLIKWNIEKFQVFSQPLVAAATDTDKSYLQLNGAFSLSPKLQWDVLLQGDHVNIGQVFVDWPSDLNIHLASQGEIVKKENQFSLPGSRIAINKLNINGELRELKLLAAGAVDFDGSHWRASDVSASLGANQLMLKGKAGSDIALEWNITAPMLNQIDPAIRGSLISSGTFASIFNNGNLTQTKMQMSAHLNQFSWGGYAVANLKSELASSDGDNYHLTLSADQVTVQQQKISQVTLDGKGNIAQHQISATILAPAYGRLDFDLDSSWKNQQWNGQWQKISWTSEKVPQWTLLSPAPISADKSQFDLKNLCLTTEFSDAVKASPSVNKTIDLAAMNQAAGGKSDQKPSVCVNSHWDDKQGFALDLTALALPLRHASGWLKPQAALDGTLQAELKVSAKKNMAALADFHLQSQDAQFVYQHDDGTINIYPVEKGSLDVALKNQQANIVSVLDWGKYGTINADAKYLLADKKIQGKLAASLTDLAPLESMLPYLNSVHGSAVANINVAGAIDNPAVTGNLNLINGSANLPQLGLELKEIGLDISSQTAGLLAVNGQILSGDGRLMLRSTMTNMGSDNWHCQGNIYGADISIIRHPELSANISPNLTFTADASAFNLNGSTEIPWARAAIKALPATATRVSADVVVVETDDPVVLAAKKAIPFYTNVILYFGDDVHFNGFGLDGRLSGKMNVLKEEKRQMLTTGFIAVNEGKYKAYGQELAIERGRLIFQGPYDNPGLDIRAVRTIDADNIIDEGVRVGLDIAGTLQQPKSKVFSVPTLDDTTAMALLLTGKPLDQLSAGDAYPILAAVSGMGVDGGPGIMSNVTSFFRLDEITIKEDKNLDQNALLIGKNITPRLMVRYIVGLLDQAFTLGMSYRITDKIRVDAESGKKQSVDVIYKIER
ncbi:MAG TPA: translocation/assembly module TamB domain-containing protein [Cellvibrio sp.]|nr:translocation/assembly module TamB domain-containing protein [Cellvibrio sp.]